MEGSVQPTPVVPGDVLAGKYQVERVLGQGAMGVVVAARHLDLGELFAIKLLLPQSKEHPQAMERFLREARAAARLKGEHVAKVTDVGRLADGSPYMVMEHLSGTDLQQHVRERGPLPVAEAVGHVLQACDAIFEAHALGIIHRDLKPSNLFLTRRANGTSCVKVLDFGISKHVTQEAVDLTKTGEVFGTPLYMAPEQMAGTKNADARCDIWSMGVVLYELLIGSTPFHATTLTEVVARVLQESAPPPSTLRRDVPAGIDAILAKCLQKRPEQRFQSIDELAAALRAQSGPGIAEPAPRVSTSELSGSYPGRSPVGREGLTGPLPLTAPGADRSSTPGVPVAPVAITAAAWGTTGHAGPPPRNAGVLPVLIAFGVLFLALAVVGIWALVRSPPAAVTTAAEWSPSSIPAASSPAAPSTVATTDRPAAAPVVTESPSPSSPKPVPSPTVTADPRGGPGQRPSLPAKKHEKLL